jgi:hypothetical protein
MLPCNHSVWNSRTLQSVENVHQMGEESSKYLNEERHCKWLNISHRLEWEDNGKMFTTESVCKDETVSGSGPVVFFVVSVVEAS